MKGVHVDKVTSDNIEAIRKRRAGLANQHFPWRTHVIPDQRDIGDNLSLMYAQGPGYPAYEGEDNTQSWAQVEKDAEFMMHAPADVDYLLTVIGQLESKLSEVFKMCHKTQDLFDALGIWTGMDSVLWDRLIYLLSGMGGYCDPAKVGSIVAEVQERWNEQQK